MLPSRGAIGANGLANARNFKTPAADFEDKETPCKLTVKWGGCFFDCALDHSPLDVVAWHGNYAPILTICATSRRLARCASTTPTLPSSRLTAPSSESGVANVDFAIFPERWQVAEHTFRPPWHHVNVMSEFMGLILGQYDAKPKASPPADVAAQYDVAAWARRCRLRAGLERRAETERLSDTLAFISKRGMRNI